MGHLMTTLTFWISLKHTSIKEIPEFVSATSVLPSSEDVLTDITLDGNERF